MRGKAREGSRKRGEEGDIATQNENHVGESEGVEDSAEGRVEKCEMHSDNAVGETGAD